MSILFLIKTAVHMKVTAACWIYCWFKAAIAKSWAIAS